MSASCTTSSRSASLDSRAASKLIARRWGAVHAPNCSGVADARLTVTVDVMVITHRLRPADGVWLGHHFAISAVHGPPALANRPPDFVTWHRSALSHLTEESEDFVL